MGFFRTVDDDKPEFEPTFITSKFEVGKCKVKYTSVNGVEHFSEFTGYVQQNSFELKPENNIYRPYVSSAIDLAESTINSYNKNTRNLLFKDVNGVFHYDETIKTAEIVGKTSFEVEFDEHVGWKLKVSK